MKNLNSQFFEIFKAIEFIKKYSHTKFDNIQSQNFEISSSTVFAKRRFVFE